MDACTHEVRLNQWKLIIEQCQSRPDGQTARPWMAENGVQEKTYYYRLRRVRKEVYSQLSDGVLLFLQCRKKEQLPLLKSP